MKLWNLRGRLCVESCRGHFHVHVLIVGLPAVRVLAAGAVGDRALSDRVAASAAVPNPGDRGGGSAGVGEGGHFATGASAGWGEARVG